MKQKTFERILLAGAAALAVFLLVSHNYNDILATTRHGINLWDILLDGDFFAFYDVNRCRPGNVYYSRIQGCSYNILVYVVFALWNLPLYLLERFADVDVMNSIPCLVYSKLMLVAALGITVAILKKILEALEIPQKKHRLLLYLYATSTVMTTIIFLVGQYDILSVIFQLLGFHAYIKREDKKFVFWFGIAFCLKYFAAVIFLPLLLLRRKKLGQWIRDLVLLIIPFLVTKLPFALHGLFAESAVAAGVGGEGMAVKLLGSMLGSSNANINVNFFMIVYACILVWCYLQKNEPEESAGNGIWVCLVSYAAFFGLLSAYPYWSVLLTSFVVLAIALVPQHLYLSLLLETAGMAALVFTNMVRHYWVYFEYTLLPMIWRPILENTPFRADYSGSLIYQIIKLAYNEERFSPIVNSVFVAAMLALAYLAYSGRNRRQMRRWPEETEYRDMLVLRFVVNAAVCLLPFIAVFL